MGSDAPSRQLDMEQGAAKAGKLLPRGELVGEARGGLARRPDICCCDPSTPQHSPTLNPPGLNGRHEPDEGTRMCGGADPKREDGHGAHLANGGDRVRERDLGEAARLVEGVLQSREKGGWVYVWARMPRLASSTWGRALQKVLPPEMCLVPMRAPQLRIASDASRNGRRGGGGWQDRRWWRRAGRG